MSRRERTEFALLGLFFVTCVVVGTFVGLSLWR